MMKKRILSIILVVLFVMLSAAIVPATAAADRTEQYLSSMTTEDKISMMIMPEYRYSYDAEGNRSNVTQITDEIEESLKKHSFSGVILFGQNTPTNAGTTRLIDALQKANAAGDSDRPQLLITIDQEGGNVARLNQGTMMPGNMASNDQVISYVFKYNGKLFCAKAANTADIREHADALDYFAENYKAQYNAIIGDADLISIDDISDSIPTQEEMDALIGKTGQELLDMGFIICNCDVSEEEISCTMEKGYAAYIMTCAGEIEYYEGIDAEALFKTMKVTKVEYNGESMAAFDIPEEE